MVRRIKYTIDYQRFSPNSRLNEIIEDVQRRYTALSDEDLLIVSAAGESYRMDEDNGESNRTI